MDIDGRKWVFTREDSPHIYAEFVHFGKAADIACATLLRGSAAICRERVTPICLTEDLDRRFQFLITH